MNETSLRERLTAMTGGGLSILILVGITFRALPDARAWAVVASMGASAVLLYVSPHGPSSQPWHVIGGHLVCATLGVACARLIPQPAVASAAAVGLSIGAMHLLRCLHPPGGGTALIAVLGSPAIHDLGFGFVLIPVLANAVSMVALAVLLNAPFPRRRYPSWLQPSPATSPAAAMPTPAPTTTPPPGPTHEEVVAALRSLDSFVDISEQDLLTLARRLAQTTARPSRNPPPAPRHL